MDKFTQFVTILVTASLISLGVVLSKITDEPVTTNQFSPENVERVRNNIPKEYEVQQHSIEPQPAKPLLTQHDLNQIECLSKNIYFESRDQGYDGMVATAWVTINRAKHRGYGDTICQVVYKAVVRNGQPVRNKCQFSWYCDGKPDTISSNVIEQRAWKEIRELARFMYVSCRKGIKPEECPVDITNGALYYFNPDRVERTPSFAVAYTKVAEIDDHVYYTR